MRVVSGEVFDVAVDIDIRKDSAMFGQWVGVYLSAENKRQLWGPEGVHGFYVTSDNAEFTLNWNDRDVGIVWPLSIGKPLLSVKDQQGVSLEDLKKHSDNKCFLPQTKCIDLTELKISNQVATSQSTLESKLT